MPAQLVSAIVYSLELVSVIFTILAAIFWWQSATTPPQLALDMPDRDLAEFNKTLERSAAKNRTAAKFVVISAGLLDLAIFMTFSHLM